MHIGQGEKWILARPFDIVELQENGIEKEGKSQWGSRFIKTVACFIFTELNGLHSLVRMHKSRCYKQSFLTLAAQSR